jgi:hypothetical protein
MPAHCTRHRPGTADAGTLEVEPCLEGAPDHTVGASMFAGLTFVAERTTWNSMTEATRGEPMRGAEGGCYHAALMSLASALGRRVPSFVRARGQEYYLHGRVQILSKQPEKVIALVEGSQLYDVILLRSEKTLRARCNCPHYLREQTVCKHIWATLLAAQILDHGDLTQEVETDEVLETGLEEPQRQPAPRRLDGKPQEARPARRPIPLWRRHLSRLQAGGPDLPPKPVDEVLYFIDATASQARDRLVLHIQERNQKANGEWGKPRDLHLRPSELGTRLSQAEDRRILSLLAGASAFYEWSSYQPNEPLPSHTAVSGELTALIVPVLCATGRVTLSRTETRAESGPLSWDDGPPWELWLEVKPGDRQGYQVTSSLRRGEERRDTSEFALLLRSGFAIDHRIARLEHRGAFGWISVLRQAGGELKVPGEEIDDLLTELAALPWSPCLDLPEELRVEQFAGVPERRLVLRSRPDAPGWLSGEVLFRYRAGEVTATTPGGRVYDRTNRRLAGRDAEFELGSLRQLEAVGFKRSPDADMREPRLRDRELGRAVRALLSAGWTVEASGSRLRPATAFRLNVSSQIDWFELAGGVEFEGQIVPFPHLLKALRRGEETILLGDGSTGMVPEDWLRRIALLAGFGATQGDAVRFDKTQLGVLDALLALTPTATFDETFAEARRQLETFSKLEPAEPSQRFVGDLRPYQKFGLGWFAFLRRFGFGGCLADDMGLGKTVQVLALLAGRQDEEPRTGASPSLVVAPRSVLFNWVSEARRFAPELRVRNHTGLGRATDAKGLDGADLILTTYGTLRRDIHWLRQVRFDYAILDEAQAIKNPASESAKAACLLSADHRLALTGTPVENHLGDLWSLLEFLNPGISGSSATLRSAAGMREPSEATRADLARAVRPFILRRTKSQVAPDLPRRTEQTIYCELREDQRRLYNELRDHYRAALGEKVDERGLARVKILVLEALLRLRQAACHPALLDSAQAGAASAKFEFLLPQLQEVLGEGHKVLVFSQFTSLLALLQHDLGREQIAYEYLDGKTRDRAARVNRFQTDPDCRLFLISLKAGGLGLNLTAADYVYLLDPWWNPAVEAQAIDRTHRIGQERHVFAYRIVAKDTVEEKILALQDSKRTLADAIIGRDDSLIRRMTREDLDMLLS